MPCLTFISFFPLDPCAFVLPKADGTGIHDRLGVHVDDGLGAGDEVFEQVISQLERKYTLWKQKGNRLHFHRNSHVSKMGWIN